MSGYINPDWLNIEQEWVTARKQDEAATDAFLIQADRDIIAAVTAVPPVGLTVGDIAIDNDGYVTSVFLQNYGIYSLLASFMRGFTGAGRGNPDDIYGSKKGPYEEDAEKAFAMITPETIKGGDGSEPIESTTRVLKMRM